MEMFSHILFALGEERRDALLEEARRARLVPKRRRFARAVVTMGRVLIALGAHLQKAGDEAEAEAV